MMSRTAAALGFCAIVIGAQSAVGQGSVELRGVVLSVEASAPLAEATVTAVFDDNRGPVTTSTQANGSFVFTGLRPGRATLSVLKSGFVPVLYGARERGLPGLAVVLESGVVRPDIVVRLQRGATVSGRIADVAGNPVAGVMVTALERRAMGADVRYLRSNGSITDDLGRFRIFGLPGGQYLLGSILGSNTGSGGSMPSAEFRLAAPTIGAGIPAPIYYPGTFVPSEAGIVNVGPGDDKQGVEFRFSRVTAAEVVGRLTTPRAGTLTGAEVIVLADPHNLSLAMGDMQSRRIEPANGAFSVSLLPGRYTILSRAKGSGGQAAGAPPTGAGLDLWAVTRVDVPDNKFIGLPLIELRQGTPVSGRVVFQVATPLAPGGPSPVGIRLLAESRREPAFALPLLPVGTDGRFSFPSVPPGRYFVDAVLPGRSVWRVSGIKTASRDLTLDPIAVEVGSPVDDIVVTVTDLRTEIVGTVVTADGRPPSDFFAVFFPTNPAYWSSNSGFRRAPARPDERGRFTFRDLPAGDYYLAVISEWRANIDASPNELARLIPSAVKVSLKDGSSITQTINVAAQ